MHPYLIEQMVQERRDALAQLARANGGARAAHRRRGDGRRGPAVRALVVLAVTTVGNAVRRRPAVRRAPALEPCGGATTRPC